QDLRHGILRRLGLFLLVGLVHGLDEVFRMVIRDELQSVRYALNQVVLADYGGHRRLIRCWLNDEILGRREFTRKSRRRGMRQKAKDDEEVLRDPDRKTGDKREKTAQKRVRS